MTELVCLDCPKEYWIAFVLESQGGEASDGYETDGKYHLCPGIDASVSMLFEQACEKVLP